MKVKARELGLKFEGDGPLVGGKGPIRIDVTVESSTNN